MSDNPESGLPETQPLVRCRRSGCYKTESTVNEFQKCSRCLTAKYCSVECHKQDWDLHKLMCNPAGVSRSLSGPQDVPSEPVPLVAGSTSVVDVVAATEEINYIPASEVSDKALIASVMSKIDMHTNPFFVFQQRGQPKGFLFVQSMSDYQHFRYVKATPETPLDRDLVCMFMTLNEFKTDVVSEHPNRNLSKKAFLDQITASVKGCDNTTHMVVVAAFGCGHVQSYVAPLAPIEMIKAVIEENKKELAQMDCLEIYLDRD